MQTVPAVSSAGPTQPLADSFSLNTMRENSTAIKMLSLSIGTTTLNCPC